MQQPDAALRRLVDETVDLIVSAQQPDGYLNVFFTVVKPEARWTNLRDLHELYTAGHLIEAGVAHHEATGSRKLLDAVCRFADHIDARFGAEPGKRRGYCGHEEIELALVRLYHATANDRYLRLARYFVDERGRAPHYFDVEADSAVYRPWGPAHGQGGEARYVYMQAHKPLREQSQVVGHAVRAMYIYSAMADLAAETGDSELLQACRRLWDDLTLGNMYITGGIGATRTNEGFTSAFDLPNLTAYAETCAAIGLVFWAQRMLRIERDAVYGDVMEKALYNGVIGGVSLDGRRFFYENPLASVGAHRRQDGFGCSCCPPNIARLLASLGGYLYSTAPGELAVHLFVSGDATVDCPEAGTVKLQLRTRYPWEGRVELALDPERSATFALCLRIPAWCPRHRLRVNGRSVRATLERGYACIRRRWRAGDRVELELAMPIQRVEAHPNVLADQGRVALQRGPLVYCVEDADHAVSVHRLGLPRGAKLSARFEASLLGGVTVIGGTVRARAADGWAGLLYRPAQEAWRSSELLAIPYFAWENRSPGGMAVWLPAAFR